MLLLFGGEYVTKFRVNKSNFVRVRTFWDCDRIRKLDILEGGQHRRTVYQRSQCIVLYRTCRACKLRARTSLLISMFYDLFIPTDPGFRLAPMQEESLCPDGRSAQHTQKNTANLYLIASESLGVRMQGFQSKDRVRNTPKLQSTQRKRKITQHNNRPHGETHSNQSLARKKKGTITQRRARTNNTATHTHNRRQRGKMEMQKKKKSKK